MFIETKYDIGQEVWYIYKTAPIRLTIDVIEITKFCINYSGLDDVGDYETLDNATAYPTKEACEQAIKEME